MKTLHITKKGTPQGDIDINIAFKGKIIAIKGKTNPNAQQFIQIYKQKGAKVIEKRDGYLINIFPPDKTFFKIGQGIEIDTEKDTDEQIESKLLQFYLEMYSKAGFQVE